MSKEMPSSIKKFIRREKARIRSQVLDVKKQEEAIKEIYNKLSNPENSPAPQAKPAEKKKNIKDKKVKKNKKA